MFELSFFGGGGGDGISFSISGPDVYVAFQAQQGSAGADVESVFTSC